LAVAPHRLDEDRKRLTMVTCRSPAGKSFADLQHIFAVVGKIIVQPTRAIATAD